LVIAEAHLMSINFGKTEVIGKSKFAPVYIAIILKESLLSTVSLNGNNIK
jgi:hypothetical protein